MNERNPNLDFVNFPFYQIETNVLYYLSRVFSGMDECIQVDDIVLDFLLLKVKYALTLLEHVKEANKRQNELLADEDILEIDQRIEGFLEILALLEERITDPERYNTLINSGKMNTPRLFM